MGAVEISILVAITNAGDAFSDCGSSKKLMMLPCQLLQSGMIRPRKSWVNRNPSFSGWCISWASSLDLNLGTVPDA
jgi:hypothetical protein